jgi:hypothetical protein
MHEELTSNSKVLRKGSLRILGPVLLAMAGFAYFMLSRSNASVAVWLVPCLLALGGFWFLLVDSRYILFLQGDRLIWADHQGRKRNTGSVQIGDVAKVQIQIVRSANSQKIAKTRVGLVTSDGKRLDLRNLRLEGRYDDLVDELRQLNPAIELEKKDVTVGEERDRA